jgi:MFS family permease
LWLGFFTVSLSTGLAIGPILGAILSVHATWRWLFWITLFLCGITFFLGVFSMNYPVPHRKQSVGIIAQLKEVDFVGCILAVAIASLICIPIEMGNKEFPWNVRTWNFIYFQLLILSLQSGPIIGMFVASAAIVPIFVFYELKVAKEPIVDMRLFAIRNVSVACLVNFITGAGYFGALFFLPRYFIDIKNSSLVLSGLQMFGIISGLAISSVFGANLISYTGQIRLIGLTGGVLYAIGSGLMLLITKDTSSANVIGWSVILGFGSGILYQPSLVIGPMSVKPHQIAGISGFLSFLRTLGGTFATALLTAIFETSFTTTLRGKIPDALVDQGLGLADDHSQYPQYSNTILDALISAYHKGSIPGIALGAMYAIAIMLLSNIDFVPAWRKARAVAKPAKLTLEKN